MLQGEPRLVVDQDICTVDAGEWDSLPDARDFQAHHGFLAACQNAGIEDCRYRYLRVYRRDELVATAVLTCMTIRLDALATGWVARLVRGSHRICPGLLKVSAVFCGPPGSFGQSCLRFLSSADRPAALALISKAMEQFAQEENASLLCFKEFAPADAQELLPHLTPRYFPARSLPFCWLELSWNSVEDYLRSMRAGYRRQYLSTRRWAAKIGLQVVRLDDVAAAAEDLHVLYLNVMDRTKTRLEILPQSFIVELQRSYPQETSAVVLKRDGISVAMAVLLVIGDRMTFLLAGLDRDVALARQAYPCLLAAVIEEAFRRGVRLIAMGQTSYAAKGRLGGETEPRLIFLRHRRKAMHRLLRWSADWLFPRFEIEPRNVFKTVREVDFRGSSLCPGPSASAHGAGQ